MRYEKMMRALKFAECGHHVRAVGQFVHFTDSGGTNRRGLLLETLREAIDAGFVSIDPIGRVDLTEAGRRRLNGEAQGSRLMVWVPDGREKEIRALAAKMWE